MPPDPDLHPPPGVTLRAVLIGVVLVLAISFISPWAILLVKGSQLTSNAIPLIGVLFLFLLTALVVLSMAVQGRHPALWGCKGLQDVLALLSGIDLRGVLHRQCMGVHRRCGGV